MAYCRLSTIKRQHHVAEMAYPPHFERQDKRVTADIKGIVQLKMIFHPIASYHFVDAGCGDIFVFIHVTVLEFYGLKEFHPVDE